MERPSFPAGINDGERIAWRTVAFGQAAFELLEGLSRNQLPVEVTDNREPRPTKRVSQLTHGVLLPRVYAPAERHNYAMRAIDGVCIGKDSISSPSEPMNRRRLE